MKTDTQLNKELSNAWESSLNEARRKAAQAAKLAEALRKLLNRLDNITSEQFAHGAERIEREAARNVLVAYESEVQR